MQIDGEQLLMTVAMNKAKNSEEARNAFIKFCSCYEERATQMALVYCSKWKKPESVAYQIVQCAFQKIWQYPTFDKSKSKCKNTDRAILNWIFWIMVHEQTLLSQSGDCSHPDAEDLPLITNPSEFIGEYFKDEYLSDEDFKRMKAELEKRLTQLKEKEITIYLTYKIYERPGRKVPRNVLNKLRTRYNITQDGIRQCLWRTKEQIEG